MQHRIYIAVPVKDRKRVISLCLPTMRDTRASMDFLVIYNDGSKEYGNDFLWQFGDLIRSVDESVGIQAQRRDHLRHYWEQRHAFDYLYFSDGDAIMDLGWRATALGLAEEHPGVIVCGYQTVAHTNMVNNVMDDDPRKDVLWTRVAPGISYLMHREVVARIMPFVDQLQHFDWQIPSILGNRCAVSRVSFVDHIGVGGERHPVGAGPDEGDRCTNPTPFLVEKRREIVAQLGK